MSETINPDEIRKEALSNYEPPTQEELERRVNELKQRGVTTELRCGECDDLTETTVLPEEVSDDNQKTICRSCTEAFLQE